MWATYRGKKWWKQQKEWFKDFGGPPLLGSGSDGPLPDSVPDSADNTKTDDNIELATGHSPFSYPSLEDIDDDDEGTDETSANLSNSPTALPVMPKEACEGRGISLRSFRETIKGLGLKAIATNGCNAQTGAKNPPSPKTLDGEAQPTRPAWGSTLPRAAMPEKPKEASLDATHPNTAEAPLANEGPRPQNDGLQYKTRQKDDQYQGKNEEPKANPNHSNNAEAPPKPEGPRPEIDGLQYNTRSTRGKSEDAHGGQKVATTLEGGGTQRATKEGAAKVKAENKLGKSARVPADQRRGGGGPPKKVISSTRRR